MRDGRPCRVGLRQGLGDSRPTLFCWLTAIGVAAMVGGAGPLRYLPSKVEKSAQLVT